MTQNDQSQTPITAQGAAPAKARTTGVKDAVIARHSTRPVNVIKPKKLEGKVDEPFTWKNDHDRRALLVLPPDLFVDDEGESVVVKVVDPKATAKLTAVASTPNSRPVSFKVFFLADNEPPAKGEDGSSPSPRAVNDPEIIIVP